MNEPLKESFFSSIEYPVLIKLRKESWYACVLFVLIFILLTVTTVVKIIQMHHIVVKEASLALQTTRLQELLHEAHFLQQQISKKQDTIHMRLMHQKKIETVAAIVALLFSSTHQAVLQSWRLDNQKVSGEFCVDDYQASAAMIELLKKSALFDSVTLVSFKKNDSGAVVLFEAIFSYS